MKTNHQFHVFCVGKAGHAFIQEGEKTYARHILKYASFECHEIKPSKKPPPAGVEDETQELLKKTQFLNPQQAKIFTLTDQGKRFDSFQFAELLKNTMQNHHQIGFMIGGAFGLSPEMIKHTQDKISLSPLTFNHDLVRIILLEQLFRALTIIYRHPYHH